MKVLLAVVVVALAAPLAAAAQPKPVPSLTPKATQQLWTKLVHQKRPARLTAGCRSVRAIFYTESDWLRLATKLAANPSPCAQYYISIPPLAANKTEFRYDQPWRIRALGPQFHVLAEINYTGWSKWADAGNGTYYQAGVTARQKMAAEGFDTAAGDTWAVNEFSSAVRAGTNVARQKVEDLVRGLYDGDGTAAVPPLQGVVFDIGYGQATADLSSYKLALQNWYLDAPFWQTMSKYVSDWSQEVYGDSRDYAVAGASPATRASYLNDYLQHMLALAHAAPAEAADAAGFLDATYAPLANGAWAWNSAYGFTNVDEPTMADYVSGQVYAMRAFDASRGAADRFGFAWAPRMADGSAWTSDFTTQSGQILDRLAAAIHDSADTPAAACSGTCTASIAGAAFTDTWKTFATWSPPALGFGAPASVNAGVASVPLTVQLQQVGIAQTAATDTPVALSSSSPSGQFAATADGPWSSTLTVVVPAGSTSASFVYRDTAAGSPTLSASTPGRQSGTQLETVTAGPAASLTVSPASASVALGASQTFTVSGADAYGNRIAAPTVTWSATSGSLSATGGTSTTFTPAATGSATVTATADTGVTAAATVTVTTKSAHVSSITYSRSGSTLSITVSTIPNATIGLRVLRSGTSYASGTFSTGSTGRLTVRVSISHGCYSTTVSSLSASGYQWDGVTPSNSYCY